MKSKLEAGGILKLIAGREILTDCYLKCETGDIIGILGRNGAGKSTLLKIIFGTVPALNKDIRIDKRPCQQPYKHKNLVGYLPQHSFLPDDISITRIIDLFIDNREQRNKVRCDERLKDHLKKRITDLSGGELKYLEVLLLVNLDVKFVLLDEPFSRVEPLYKERIIALIREYRSTKGFIITDHDYANIIEVSDSIVLIVNGVCKHIKALEELEFWNYLPAGTLR